MDKMNATKQISTFRKEKKNVESSAIFHVQFNVENSDI